MAGQIFITNQDRCFPEAGWWDFPEVIVDWWIDAIASNGSEFELQFMDGPMLVVGRRMEGGVISLRGTTTAGAGKLRVSLGTSTDGEIRAELLRARTLLVAERARIGGVD